MYYYKRRTVHVETDERTHHRHGRRSNSAGSRRVRAAQKRAETGIPSGEFAEAIAIGAITAAIVTEALKETDNNVIDVLLGED